MRIFGGGGNSSSASVFLFTTVVAVSRLGIALPHTDIATNSNTASLVGNGLAQLGALHQTGKLLGTVDTEGVGLDLHSPVDARGQVAILGVQVVILLLLGGFKQAESQAVSTLVSNGEIREDEISRLGRAIKISHTRSRDTGEDGRVGSCGSLHTAMDDGTSMLETGIEEEIGVVIESDILTLLDRRAFNDS